MARDRAVTDAARKRSRFWLSAYPVVTFLSFPHPVAGSVLDLGPYVAWFAPALLALGLQGRPTRNAAWVGFLASLAAHTAVLHWIYVVTVTYGRAPVIAGLVAPVALAAYIAVFGALFAAVWAYLANRGPVSPWVGAALWAAVDHLRSFALTGFPWATLGYAHHEQEALLALAPYTGVYGLCFVTALGGLAVARFAAELGERVWPSRAVTGAVLGVALAFLLGSALAAQPPEPAGGRLRVAALQGNIDQGEKWSASRAADILANYMDLARQAAAAGAEVVVWPETSAPGSPSTDPDLAAELAALARETETIQVVGAVAIELRADSPRFYDSAFLLGPDGSQIDRYDKGHLVPFGEYVPLRNLFGLFLRAVARGMAPDNVTPGDGPRAVDLPRPGGGVLRAGVPICYELLFPNEMRGFARDGATVLFAITNDAWYGRTGAPYQFLAMTAVRAAESGLAVVRAANTGVSALIDADGGVREQTPIFERDWLSGEVALRAPDASATFYVRHGDVFAWGCWTVGLVAIVASRFRRQGGSES